MGASAREPGVGERAPSKATTALFAGPGELRARCRALDWAATPLGPVEDWPSALQAAVRLCLDAGFPSCLYAGDALVLVYNDGFVEALGRKSPWALGRSAAEVWPEAWDQIAPDFDRVRSTGAPVFRPDQRFVLDRGPSGAEEGFFTFAFSPVRDEAGAIIGVLSTVVETTDRVRTEAALAADRARLRAVLDAAPAVVAIYSGPAHVLTYVNPTWERVVGKPDALGRTAREVFPEMIATGIWDRLDRVYETGEPQTISEMRLPLQRHPGGPVEESVWSFVWMPLPGAYPVGPSGHGGDLLVHAVEVTAQVRAREESEAARADADTARARSEAVLASIADAFYLVDHDWRFTYVNDAAEPLLQTTREQLLGRTLWEAFPGVLGSPFEGPYREAMATGRTTSAEAYFPPLGTWFDVRSYPWAGGLMVHFRDIGARKAAEVEREQLLAEAEAARRDAETANRSKGEFLAVMSHELRTPLNAIGGYAELMELGIHGPVTPEQRTALDRIQRSQRALLSVINEVLNYARLETGAVTYDLADVPVAEAVAAAEVLVAPQLRAKGLGYTWAGCEPALAVRADRDKLQQVLLNLLSNAIKFTEARDGQAGRLEVTCMTEPTAAGRVVLRVRDTGVGIAADKLKAVFEPFVQVDQRLTREHSGTGLGLAISRDLARGMGGDLTVESTPGVGSTFTLTLPRAG